MSDVFQVVCLLLSITLEWMFTFDTPEKGNVSNENSDEALNTFEILFFMFCFNFFVLFCCCSFLGIVSSTPKEFKC